MTYDPREWDLSDDDRRLHEQERLRDCVSTMDAWSLDIYLLNVLTNGLRKLANNSHGVPMSYNDAHADVDSAFKTWVDDLNDAADKFDKLRAALDEDAGFIVTEDLDQLRIEAFKFVSDNLYSLWD